MNRPFFNFRIAELEVEFASRRDDAEFLRALVDELRYRSTDRAANLNTLALEALSRSEKPSKTSLPDRSSSPRVEASPQAKRVPVPPLQEPKVAGAPAASSHLTFKPKEITDEPEGILDSWIALEVLSPPTFRRLEDLAGGDRQAVAWLDRDRLPWEGTGEKARGKGKLFYQVVLGTIDLGPAIGQLLTRYTDSRVERPSAQGEAIMGVAILDREGRLAEGPATSVSSFAWGVPRALRGELTGLADWRNAERLLVGGLDEILRSTDEDAEALPLDRATLMAGWRWLVARLDLPDDLVAPPRFAIRSYTSFKSTEPPEPLLTNSFFLKDLIVARELFSQGKATCPASTRFEGRRQLELRDPASCS